MPPCRVLECRGPLLPDVWAVPMGMRAGSPAANFQCFCPASNSSISRAFPVLCKGLRPLLIYSLCDPIDLKWKAVHRQVRWGQSYDLAPSKCCCWKAPCLISCLFSRSFFLFGERRVSIFSHCCGNGKKRKEERIGENIILRLNPVGCTGTFNSLLWFYFAGVWLLDTEGKQELKKGSGTNMFTWNHGQEQEPELLGTGQWLFVFMYDSWEEQPGATASTGLLFLWLTPFLGWWGSFAAPLWSSEKLLFFSGSDQDALDPIYRIFLPA